MRFQSIYLDMRPLLTKWLGMLATLVFLFPDGDESSPGLRARPRPVHQRLQWAARGGPAGHRFPVLDGLLELGRLAEVACCCLGPLRWWSRAP